MQVLVSQSQWRPVCMGTKSKVDRGLHSCTRIFSLYFPSMATIILKCGLLRGYITTLCCFKTLLFAWSRWSLMKQLAFSQISPVCLFLSANPANSANPTLLQCFFLTPRQPPCLDQDMEFVKTATSSICVNSFPDRVANLLWALAAKTQHGKVAEF